MPGDYVAVDSDAPGGDAEPADGAPRRCAPALCPQPVRRRPPLSCAPRAALLGLTLALAAAPALLLLSAGGPGAPGAGGAAGLRGAAGPEEKFGLLPSPHFSIFELSLKAYSKLFGNSDPFRFQCPLPLPIRGLAPQEGLSSTLSCCQAYAELSWPYQFPACRNATNCSSCWRASGSAALARQAAGVELAGAAWAAVVTTKGHAKSKWGWVASKIHRGVTGLMANGPTAESVSGRRMLATLGSGLHMHEVDLCPRVGDWEMHMLNLESQNIHARVFKSHSAKLAIVAFRGTQATSVKNWQVDADIESVPLRLGSGSAAPTTQVHGGFLSALGHVLPQIRKWVEGSFFHIGAVPADWTLVFTGHSLGGALALLAATLAEVHGWKRKPDMTITWGAPRVADKTLNDWWESQGFCRQLLRVNAYNDVIHWCPFKKMWNWWTVLTDIMGSASKDGEREKNVAFSDSSRWMHVCNNSEFIVPSSMKGLNEHLQDFSPVGAILSHFVSNCLFGYSYGVMHGEIARHDTHCGIGPSMCPGLS